MIELHNESLQQNDLEAFQQRADDRRQRFRRRREAGYGFRESAVLLLKAPSRLFKSLPARYLLHLIVVLLVPLATVLSVLQPMAASDPNSMVPAIGDMPLGLAPIALNDPETGSAMVGDPPLPDIDAIPVPVSLDSRSEALAPLVVPGTIAGDVVRLRNGPGLDYDEVARVDSGAPIEVIGRFGDWLQVRRPGETTGFWVAGELVDIAQAAVFNLTEVPQALIPPPPPPKVGTVVENNLNLRDGPGTNYVPMVKMNAGQDLTLIEQYQGWFLVEYGELYGWVSSEFLRIPGGIVERVPVAQQIPDPNPPLVGSINDNKVNLRKGPGSAYDRITQANVGAEVQLLARHKDWYRVQLGDGTKAWVFSELLNVTPMAHRRVPVTNDIPPLPASARLAGGNAAGIRASGDVAGFAVQFVGYRYVYGGASPGSGFDCSGLTSYVYRQFGVRIPRTAAAQYSSSVGAMVGSINNLQPGDLVFFVNTGGRRGISHVAIYIGGGRIVHAMTPRYGVQVSSIWSSYWVSHYYGAIRVRR